MHFDVYILGVCWSTLAKMAISYCVVHVHPGSEVVDMSQQIISFTSIPFVDDLVTDGLTYVGTLRSNKPHLPDAMKANNNREVHSLLLGVNDQMTLVSYVPGPTKYVVALPACIMMLVLQEKCTRRRLSCITMPPRVEWTTSTTYPLCTSPGDR